MVKINLLEIFNSLYRTKDPQGWWPCPDYHPEDYSYPRTEEEKLEIILGAILTQYC